jgi:hypothetical protein
MFAYEAECGAMSYGHLAAAHSQCGLRVLRRAVSMRLLDVIVLADLSEIVGFLAIRGKTTRIPRSAVGADCPLRS